MAFIRQALRVAAILACLSTANGQTREETLRAVSGTTINSLDPTLLTATRESIALGMVTYDRLVTFAHKTQDGHRVFDFAHPIGELAESFSISADGRTMTFRLHPGATFHDGSPVTVDDVKWSLDRAVTAKSGAVSQLATGSLTKPDQFTIIDDHIVQVSLEKPDQLALGNLATPFARVINSKLAKAHATPDDPWASSSCCSATTPGKAASCPISSASSSRLCPRPQPAPASSSVATPTSPSTCRQPT